MGGCSWKLTVRVESPPREWMLGSKKSYQQNTAAAESTCRAREAQRAPLKIALLETAEGVLLGRTSLELEKCVSHNAYDCAFHRAKYIVVD